MATARAGLVAVAPVLIGIIPFGLIFGIAAIEAGLDPVTSYGMSAVVFAGSAQLAAIDLIARDAAPLVIIGTALVINSRHLMYSAALVPHLTGLGFGRRLAAGYLLTDQAFAVSITRYAERDLDLGGRFAFLIGSGLGLWATWQLSTLAGVIAGATVPESWSLDFAVPLVFLALMVTAIRDRTDTFAAIVAGVFAVALVGLPYNLGLPVAALAGVTAGLITPLRAP